MSIYAVNRRARYDYHLEETLLAGIQLMGTEVKSIRNGRVSLKGAFCSIDKGELWLRAAHISEYPYSDQNHDPTRHRKLLVTRRQLNSLIAAHQQGRSIIPTKLISKGNFIKCEVAIARPKKQYDKRQTLRQKDDARRSQKAIKAWKS